MYRQPEILRCADAADIAALQQLVCQPDRTNACRALAANADGVPSMQAPGLEANTDTVVAETGEGVLGFVQLRWSTHPPSREWMRDSVEVRWQYVHERHRGTGVAARLLAAALRLVQQRGMRGAWLKVAKDAPAAIAFYLKCGFRIVGTAICAEGSQPLERWVMHRRVSAADCSVQPTASRVAKPLSSVGVPRPGSAFEPSPRHRFR